MIDLIKAEQRKILGQRWLAGLVFYIWPIGGVLYTLVPALMALASPRYADYYRQYSSYLWWESAVLPWRITFFFMGQALLTSIAAIAFGNEYNCKTWENLTLRRRRFTLALVKLLALWMGLMLSFLAMSILMAVGSALFKASLDLPLLPAGADPARFTSEFIQLYLRTAAFSGLVLALILSIGACAAIIGRSPIGGVLGGWLLLFADMAVLYAGYEALTFHVAKQFANLQLTRISYNTTMGASHILGSLPPFGLPQRDLSFNVAALALWLAFFLGLALWRLHQQDMT